MDDEQRTVFRGDLAVIDGEVEEDVGLVVGSDGTLTSIRRFDGGSGGALEGEEVIDLGRVAMIPGQVNIHSHAFQRSMRGRTEYQSEAAGGDNFWSWRREMYAWAHRLTPEEMAVVGRMAFLEMARAGITHVGEFHYVHHRPDGELYDRAMEMAFRLMEAAQEVGIRMTMMPVAYETGDIKEPPREAQRRFISPSVEQYLEWVEEMEAQLIDEPSLSIGVAPHSIRAVSRGWLEVIAGEARARGWPLHIHACEQRREVRRSKEVYGMAPIEAFHEWGLLDEGWTLIHGTHLEARELDILEEVRPTIGACPTTERNLGDGFLEARELVARDVPIALGSDSHTMIDPFAEMRLVEYHERLRAEARNVLAGKTPGVEESANVLWPMGTRHGARALGSDDGRLEVGAPADFVALDLRHPSLAGTTAGTLLSDIVLSMSAAAVTTTVVDGEMVVSDGAHRAEEDIVEAFASLTRRYEATQTRQ